jgi:hypothetical protein
MVLETKGASENSVRTALADVMHTASEKQSATRGMWWKHFDAAGKGKLDVAAALRAAKRALGEKSGKTSTTIKLGAALTPAARKSLHEMGYGVDERGGDAITTRARDRHALRTGQSVRRTARVLILSKRDGSPMTDRDVQHARAAIEAAAK